MTIKERLQIILITYNRAPHLRNTLAQLFEENSPVKDFNFTILDNKSTDETPDIISEYQKQHQNITHIIHNHNIGGNANIARALELATYDYAWFICDDDTFHWEGWKEVESAVSANEPLICACNFNIKSEYRSREEYIYFQMTFLPSCIFSRGVLSDLAIRNAYDGVFHWFPHLAPVALHLNGGGKIHLLTRGLVTPWSSTVPRNKEQEVKRDSRAGLTRRSQKMNFVIGYSNAIMNLEGRDHGKYFSVLFDQTAAYPGDPEGLMILYRTMFFQWTRREDGMRFCDILTVAPLSVRIMIRAIRFLQCIGLSRMLKGSWLYRAMRKLADRR